MSSENSLNTTKNNPMKTFKNKKVEYSSILATMVQKTRYVSYLMQTSSSSYAIERSNLVQNGHLLRATSRVPKDLLSELWSAPL